MSPKMYWGMEMYWSMEMYWNGCKCCAYRDAEGKYDPTKHREETNLKAPAI